MLVRAETSADREAVREVNERAFGRAAEADLVDALREGARPHVSLVAGGSRAACEAGGRRGAFDGFQFKTLSRARPFGRARRGNFRAG
jgi:hypothetical protein